MRKKEKKMDLKMYEALNIIMNECSLHGQCDCSCPLYDEEWKCIRNMPPAYWKAFVPKVLENSRKELPNDVLFSYSCDGCVDHGNCDNKTALESVGLRIEDLGCRNYRTKNSGK